MNDDTLTATDSQVRYRQVRFVTLVGSLLDFALGVVKIVAGWLTHSHALVADGVHSFSDLATDVLVIYAAKHAHAEADADHPYGHARFETAATVGLGVALVLIGIGIAIDNVGVLFDPSAQIVPAAWALVVAAVSVASKEAIYHYTMVYARRLRSNMLRANAWHSRSDALSSVVVFIGVGGALLGLPYLDAVAALIVAWMIAKIGFDFAWSSVRELVDTGLSPERLSELRGVILDVGGVRDLHLLRTRQMAGRTLVDVHIILDDARMSVSEGHQISETVRARLIRQFDDVEDVTVHIDPEDDEVAAPSRHLRLRREMLARLRERWRGLDAAEHIRHVTLHYLDGRIHVEIELPLMLLTQPGDADALTRAFREAVGDDPDIGGVRLLFS